MLFYLIAGLSTLAVIAVIGIVCCVTAPVDTFLEDLETDEYEHFG